MSCPSGVGLVAVLSRSSVIHARMSYTHARTAEHRWASLTDCVDKLKGDKTCIGNSLVVKGTHIVDS